ncbi:MAG: hypothetical protein PVH84_11610, partial [Candidatus Aminicenantes bacterium]
MRAGLYDEAIEICKDALKINQSWSSFYRLEAKSHWLKGDREKAYASIERYGNSFPNYQERKYYYSGLFFSFDGQYKKALTELVKAAEISQTKMNTSLEMGVRFDIGKLLTEMGQSSRALEEFAQAQELSKDVYDESFDPVPILVNYLAGIAMVKKGD